LGDETGVKTDSNRVRGYGRKGQAPVLAQTARKEHISMISAINNEGRLRFMMYWEAMTSQKLITFMARFIKDTGRKVYLILDNLKVHHSRRVMEWVEAHMDTIELFYLPAYSPELNPDQYFSGDLRNRAHSGIPVRTDNDLKHKIQSFMRMLTKRPRRVRSHFRHPKVAYAA
jgi:transposase